MPNWCSNNVTVDGKLENIKAFLLNVYTQYKTRTSENIFLLHSNNEMYMFDFASDDFEISELDSKYINDFEDTSISFRYDSRWSPNTVDIQFIGKTFHLNTHHSFEEMGMAIYGECSYHAETTFYSEKILTQEEIDNCTNTEGETDWDELENILNSKDPIYV